MDRKLIPNQTLGLLADILPHHYTHATIDTLFFKASAPAEAQYSWNNKESKVQSWLRTVNDASDNPLEVLGAVLEEFMEATPPDSCFYAGKSFESEELAIAAFHGDRDKIARSLVKAGLQYTRGGHIVSGGASPTRSLQEHVRQLGLQAVDIEIRRALENVEKDPVAATQYAGNVLEAALKTYLERYGIAFKESDTLSDIWKKAVDHIGLHPKELDDKDLKKIASGLHTVVDGIMHLRNKKSASHGKSDSQMKSYDVLPRQARLALHAAHTVSVYILELL